MTSHEFIFSKQIRHWLARHILFWIIWCFAFNLLFHFPIHVFKGWNINSIGTKNYQVLGPTLFFIKTLIVNSFLAVLLPQMALVYTIIYWLLPNYFFQRKNAFAFMAITLSILIAFYFFAIIFKSIPSVYNKIAGTSTSIMPLSAFKNSVLIDQISSLPIILGFVLMIKLIKHWWVKQKEADTLIKEKTNVELQILKAQVHPHFLFNTINSIYFYSLSNLTETSNMINKLSGILKYIISECKMTLIPLEKEVKIICDYMELEKTRYSQYLKMTITIDPNLTGKAIAPLLLLPFVENCFKHGASKMISHSWITLNIYFEKNRLHFILMNNKPRSIEKIASKDAPATESTRKSNNQGNIGLNNVMKRLQLLYPGEHELNIVSKEDIHTINLSILLQDIRGSKNKKDELNPNTGYAFV